jgi:hypothetical protein
MSNDLFRKYAEEAMRRAVQSKNEKEQSALIELARTWTQSTLAASGLISKEMKSASASDD